MDGKRNLSLRSLRRQYEPHRLEEQLWAMAYEQIWPLLCQGLKVSRPVQSSLDQRSIETYAIARRA